MPKTPTIFLSYSRANADVADSIDNDFKRIGITFRRDIRDVAYLDDFTEFMNSINKSDFVVTLISDEFLKSEWCMYEMTQLLKMGKFHKKVLPVLLNDDVPIKKIEGRLTYYKYWKNLLEKHEYAKMQHPNNKDIIEVIKRHKKIVDKLDDFFDYIAKLNLLSIHTLKQYNYRLISDFIGFSDKDLIEKLLAIPKIVNKEERFKELHMLEKEYPNNKRICFAQGIYYEDNKEYTIAEIYYRNALEIDSKFTEAYNNLGLIYQYQLKNYNVSKQHYEKALSCNNEDSITHYNLANLLKNCFNDYINAGIHYGLALRFNPFFTAAHVNYGALLEKFGEYKLASLHYQRALLSNPDSVEAYINLGYLHLEKFRNYKTAKVCYVEALRIDPEDSLSHFHLAIVLTILEEYEESKNHYIKATELNASLIRPELDADFSIER